MAKFPRGIKKEPASLLRKSIDSLALAVELFNRPSDVGRSDSVLILLDHAFEMLLKAGILHRGGRIRDPGMSNTIGFNACVSRARSNATCKFLSDDDGIVLVTINALRDASQHHLSEISEEQLYLHVQSGVTLFRSLLIRVFDIDIVSFMPRRVLPLSTVAFTSIEALFDQSVAEVQKLLAPGKRRRQEAIAALRPLAIMDRAITGDDGQPSERGLHKFAERIRAGEDWRTIFLGINLIECVAENDGPTISLRINKKEGIDIQIVRTEDEADAALALKRVDELSYYNLSPAKLAEHLQITQPKCLALRRHLKLEEDSDFYKEFAIDSQSFGRFSYRGLERARQEMERLTDEQWKNIWETHRPRKGAGMARSV